MIDLLKRALSDARVRLSIRSVLVGAAVAAEQAAEGDLSLAALKAAGIAGAWAALEAFTPLNALVGWFKRS